MNNVQQTFPSVGVGVYGPASHLKVLVLGVYGSWHRTFLKKNDIKYKLNTI